MPPDPRHRVQVIRPSATDYIHLLVGAMEDEGWVLVDTVPVRTEETSVSILEERRALIFGRREDYPTSPTTSPADAPQEFLAQELVRTALTTRISRLRDGGGPGVVLRFPDDEALTSFIAALGALSVASATDDD